MVNLLLKMNPPHRKNGGEPCTFAANCDQEEQIVRNFGEKDMTF